MLASKPDGLSLHRGLVSRMRYQCFAYVRALFLAVICGALIPPFAFRFTVRRRREFSPGFRFRLVLEFELDSVNQPPASREGRGSRLRLRERGRRIQLVWAGPFTSLRTAGLPVV